MARRSRAPSPGSLFSDGEMFSLLTQRHLEGGDDATLPRCIDYLHHHKLTWEGQAYEVYGEPPESTRVAQAIQRGRVMAKSPDELRAAQQRYRDSPVGKEVAAGLTDAQQAIWDEHKRRGGNDLRLLSLKRLPADAIAFYRYFHVEPFNEWGIYFDIPKLLDYAQTLHHNLASRRSSFSFEAVLHCALFEIFHHEFFHHIVECAATTLELLQAMQGTPRSLFREYRGGEFTNHPELEPPHSPLEEALANAYAYNSFGFLSRVQLGYTTVLGRSYQTAIEAHWDLEGPGYRDAAHYTGGSYLPGGAQLLAMILNQPKLDSASLLMLVKHVLLTGHSAYAQKPDIPTYLIGDESSITRFHDLVPAPNETYTRLHWAADTDALDSFLREKRKEEQKQKEAAKQTANTLAS